MKRLTRELVSAIIWGSAAMIFVAVLSARIS
jgi:hypothetical protein